MCNRFLALRIFSQTQYDYAYQQQKNSRKFLLYFFSVLLPFMMQQQRRTLYCFALYYMFQKCFIIFCETIFYEQVFASARIARHLLFSYIIPRLLLIIQIRGSLASVHSKNEFNLFLSQLREMEYIRNLKLYRKKSL